MVIIINSQMTQDSIIIIVQSHIKLWFAELLCKTDLMLTQFLWLATSEFLL